MFLEYFYQLSQSGQALVIGLLAAVVTYWCRRPKQFLPGGPRGLPLVGQIFDLDSDTIDTFAEWAKYFGSYFTVYYGRVPSIVLNTKKAVDEAFVKQQNAFTGRPDTYSAKQLSSGQKGLLHSDYTPALRQQRKVVHMALRSYSFLPGFRLETKVNQSIARVVEVLKTEKTAVDPRPFMELISFNVLSGVCFDKIHELDDKDFQTFMERYSEIRKLSEKPYFLEDYILPLRWLPTSRVKKLMVALRRMKRFIGKKLEAHKDSFDPESVRDVTDAMLLSQLEDEEEEVEMSQRLTDEHIEHTLLDIFTAGHDPIILILTWTLLYVAAHQEVQQKLHQELDSVLESRSVSSLTDRSSTPYLQAVISESMRLSTPTPLSLPRTAMADCSLEHYDIKKGNSVIVNHWYLNHDPQVWEEPDSFLPERFLTEDGKPKTMDQFIPFSVGRRSCVGEYLAKPQLHLILAAILKQFHLSIPDEQEVNLKPVFRGNHSEPRPFKVIFKSRS